MVLVYHYKSRNLLSVNFLLKRDILLCVNKKLYIFFIYLKKNYFLLFKKIYLL